MWPGEFTMIKARSNACSSTGQILDMLSIQLFKAKNLSHHFNLRKYFSCILAFVKKHCQLKND